MTGSPTIPEDENERESGGDWEEKERKVADFG
jgi:hypothetical protein